MTVDDVIASVKIKASSRTRSMEDALPYPDELLVAEIERLRKELARAESIILACHRAFTGGSDFVCSQAKHLAAAEAGEENHE